MKKKPLALAALGLIAFVAAACNTVEGVGEDVGATGEAVEGAANGAEAS